MIGPPESLCDRVGGNFELLEKFDIVYQGRFTVGCLQGYRRNKSKGAR